MIISTLVCISFSSLSAYWHSCARVNEVSQLLVMILIVHIWLLNTFNIRLIITLAPGTRTTNTRINIGHAKMSQAQQDITF